MLQQEFFEDGLRLEHNSNQEIQRIKRNKCCFGNKQFEVDQFQSIFYLNIELCEISESLYASLVKLKNSLTFIGHTEQPKLNAKLWTRPSFQVNMMDSLKQITKDYHCSYHLYCYQKSQKLNLSFIYSLIKQEIQSEIFLENIEQDSNSDSNFLQTPQDCKKFKEIMKERKCTMISIQWTKGDDIKKFQNEAHENYFQIFEFFIDSTPQRNPLGSNQYEIQLKSFQLKAFYQIYKYFLKQKINSFKPKIMILLFDSNVERQVCQLLISKLNKFSSKMIIIPSQFNYDQICGIIQGCQQVGNKVKSQNLRQNPIEAYTTYKEIYEQFIKTNSEKQFYKSQLKSLLLLSKCEMEENNLQMDEEDELKSELSFPYMYNDRVSVLLIKCNVDFKNYKYFVDYQKSQIIIISLGQINQITWNQESSQVKYIYNTKYQAYQKETYYYYQEKLYVFYGYNEKNQWSSDIRVYNFYSNSWETYTKQKESDRSIQYYSTYQGNERYDFSVVPCFVNPRSDGEVHFSLVGGTLETSNKYCNMIEDIIFFNNGQYQSSVWKKETYKNSFKESLNPLLWKYEKNQFVYFEGRASKSLNSSPYCRALLVTMKDIGKYKLQCESIEMNQTSYQLFQKYSGYLNSISCNLLKEDDRKFKILINYQDKVKLDQSQVSQQDRLKNLSKYYSNIYIILQFQFKIDNNVLKLEIKEEEFSFYDQQNAINLSQVCLTQNWIDNIDDTQIYLDEVPYQYILQYKNELKKFVFENFSQDYDESVIIQQLEQTISVVRLYVPNKLVFYQIPYVYLQDVKDSVDDNEITSISLNQCLEMDLKNNNNNNILYFYQKSYTEYVIQLENDYIIVERLPNESKNGYRWKHINIAQEHQFNQNINVQQPYIQFMISTGKMYLFYERIQITNNIGFIRYFGQKETNTIQVSLNQLILEKIKTKIQMSIIKIRMVKERQTLGITFYIQDGNEAYEQDSLFNLSEEGSLKFNKDQYAKQISQQKIRKQVYQGRIGSHISDNISETHNSNYQK